MPIQLGYLDYKNKVAGVGGTVYPTGDYAADEEKIKAFYRTIQARFPAQGVR